MVRIGTSATPRSTPVFKAVRWTDISDFFIHQQRACFPPFGSFYSPRLSPIASQSSLTRVFHHCDHNIEAFKNGRRKGKVYRREGCPQGRCGENPEVPQREGWLAGQYINFPLFMSMISAHFLSCNFAFLACKSGVLTVFFALSLDTRRYKVITGVIATCSGDRSFTCVDKIFFSIAVIDYPSTRPRQHLRSVHSLQSTFFSRAQTNEDAFTVSLRSC